jgi:hypothetical protein
VPIPRWRRCAGRTSRRIRSVQVQLVPVNATRQVNRATRDLQQALLEAVAVRAHRAHAAGRHLAIGGRLDHRHGRRGGPVVRAPHGPAHRLVLFDVNRTGRWPRCSGRAPAR